MKGYRFTFSGTIDLAADLQLDVNVQAVLEAHVPADQNGDQSGGGVIIEKITNSQTGLEITDNDFWDQWVPVLTDIAHGFLTAKAERERE